MVTPLDGVRMLAEVPGGAFPSAILGESRMPFLEGLPGTGRLRWPQELRTVY